MSEAFIEVHDVKKAFRITKREQGILSTMKSMVKPSYELKKAVDGVSFQIQQGEMVGFIGPNGSGKSTTVKMLSGILHPDSGTIRVAGFIPYQDRKKYVSHIGVVFGQKSQLAWDLPVIESFDLLKYIYRIPEQTYQDNLERFVTRLEMSEFLNQPVRQLSLGQRMRADIVAALLHSPQIVFFDEPTIGVDVVGKERIREFIVELNRTEKITMLFTTHDMQDIEKTCKRIMIIDNGKEIYDGNIATIKERFGNERTLELLLDNDMEVSPIKDVNVTNLKEQKRRGFRLEFDKNKVSMDELMKQLFSQYPIKDMSMAEPQIESIIRKIYEGGVVL